MQLFVFLIVLLCLGILSMAGKSGNKRKKDKNSPSQTNDSENKRQIANYGGCNYNVTSPMQGLTQPGNQVSSVLILLLLHLLTRQLCLGQDRQ